ncbi:MAG: chromosomal replication initiator protein DnaA [Clostridia bacterium]|nr:chromosomal replication initiator protein DnaA [Clostridia bacterium]
MPENYNNCRELMEKVKMLSLDNGMQKIAFDTWISPIELASINENTINLVIPSDFYTAQIKLYEPLLINCFKVATNKDVDFSYNINYITEADLEKQTLNASTVSFNTQQNSNIDPKYTFSNFVIGQNNRFAQAAAYAVSEAPGTAYNPLFIYGGVGLGKTHLMHAIGNEVLRRSPSKKVLYVTSEKFTNEFINGIKDNSNEHFRQKYRNIDVLLIDDIQFIAGKKGIQEEFFHTFNTICENKGQIVLTSDKPPKDINPLEERLKSRFDWGLLVDISTADYETRLAILRKKVQQENIVIDDIVLSNIATKVDTNIRELEGTLKKIVAQASLTHSPITFDLAEKAIADVIAHKERIISPEFIKESVAKYYNVPLDDINSSKRSNEIAYARQVAMYLCRELAKMQYKNIGAAFGNRDHSTVMHACEKVKQTIKHDNEAKTYVDSVKNIILKPIDPESN